MKSMTGFGRAGASSSSVELEITVKSVNSRFLETRPNLPSEYISQENEIRNLVGKHFSRGRVDVVIRRRSSAKSKDVCIDIDADLAKEYFNAFKNLGKTLKLPAKLSLELIAKQPGVVKDPASLDISKVELALLLETIGEALVNCDNERRREGKSVLKEITSLLEQLEVRASEMEAMRERANKALEDRFRSRLIQLGFSPESADQRLWQEVSIQIDRSDIREELVRLREHIRVYGDLVRQRDPQGKKLDFYTQELLREANTIGSKSQIAELTQTVVEAKTLIEKLREQVQNIE